jgi:hypothetical protein
MLKLLAPLIFTRMCCVPWIRVQSNMFGEALVLQLSNALLSLPDSGRKCCRYSTSLNTLCFNPFVLLCLPDPDGHYCCVLRLLLYISLLLSFFHYCFCL